MASGRKRVMVLGLALVALVGCAYWLLVRGQPRVTFFGLVVDERGEPVSDAEVRVYVAESRIDEHGAGRLVPETAKDHWLRTDAGGRFALQGIPGNYLAVAVSKLDHEWVYDLAVAAKTVPELLDANLTFSFDPKGRMYIPDASRPAVFPLFRTGSLVLGRTSRGG